jgi:hypothetical protein
MRILRISFLNLYPLKLICLQSMTIFSRVNRKSLLPVPLIFLLLVILLVTLYFFIVFRPSLALLKLLFVGLNYLTSQSVQVSIT